MTNNKGYAVLTDEGITLQCTNLTLKELNSIVEEISRVKLEEIKKQLDIE